MSLSAEVLVNLVAIETDAADIARNTRVTRADYFASLTEGTAANQAQIVWSDSRVSGGTDTLQLSSLSDTRDGAGVTVAFSTVKVLYLKNTHAANSIAIAVVEAGIGQTVRVQPGGVFLLANPSDQGNATGIGSALTYNITATVGTTYDLVIVGEGAVI